MPKNVGELGKLIAANGFNKCPKSKKLPNLVALILKLVPQKIPRKSKRKSI